MCSEAFYVSISMKKEKQIYLNKIFSIVLEAFIFPNISE